MSTLSVPLTPELQKFVEQEQKATGRTRADIVRQAIKHYAEEQAVQRILKAKAEPTLSGDLDDLLARID